MALAVIWISVALGVVLGLWQRVAAPTTGPIRTFAVVAAGVLVAMSLLPHAILSEGLAGLGAALASVALVPALERLLRVPFRRVNTEWLRLELGYAGLLIHRFGDGVVMSVEGHGRELSWAVGAHEIPIVALVTLAYARRGLRPALLRAAVLGLSSSLGFWVVRAMPGQWHELHGWVDAVAAGILVHILAYEALPENLETSRQRTFDGLGAALGLSIVLLPSLEEHDDAPHVAANLLGGALSAAPWLLLGLLASAALLARSPGRDANAARVGSVRPWPAVEAYTLSAGLLGWLPAVLWWLAGTGLSAVGRLLVRRLGTLGAGVEAVAGEAPAAAPEPGFWPILESLVLRVAGWIGLGLLTASYIQSFVTDPLAFAALDTVALGSLLLAVALPSALCSAGAVPIAAALVSRGLSPTIVLAGLALGPVLSGCARALGRQHVASWRTGLALVGLAGGWLVLALAADAALGPSSVAALALRAMPNTAAFATPGNALEWAALAGLGLIAAKSIWRVGVRGWLGASLRALGFASRSQHAHAH